ncbi:MAG: flagellar basal body L-ring protein FlgH [Deltaproteobacteria bacterium]|nr:flagellar basal body L-ring protein FlgH [Deltaproteobacteria bacterium]
MQKKKYFLRCFSGGLICSLLLSGCVSTGETPGRATMPDRFSLPEARPQQFARAEGSIYSDQAMDLYRDSRACRVGDLVMVEIVETSSGAKNARTKTERESIVAGGISQLFGFEKWLSNKNANFIPSDKSLEVDLQNDFEGKGSTERNSKVTATVSARVVDVTLEGNLVIQGYREIRVNNETQFLVLSGIVRPKDITPNNSVKSTYLADARIEYSGTGVVSDKQQPGWLARGVDILWPF